MMDLVWWKAPKNNVHGPLFDHVRALDRQQFEIYNTFRKLEYLYDTTRRSLPRIAPASPQELEGRMHENLIASFVDTVSAQTAVTEVRAVFDTDDADWSTQRLAKDLEWYSEDLAKQQDVHMKCRHAFKVGGALKGTGAIRVWIDSFDRVRSEVVPVDDIVVDETEARSRDPRQLHQRSLVDRDEMRAEYPKFAVKIDAAQGGAGAWQTWAGWRPIRQRELVILRSWWLPIGVRGSAGYVAGRYVEAIDGCTLRDEEYHEDYFPFSIMRWTRPASGWYGIGMAFRIMGIQAALNRRNLQMERKLDHGAFPTTWVQQQDMALATRQATMVQNPLGTVAVYRGTQAPTTVTPSPISPDELQDAERLSRKAGEVAGISRLAAQAVKPAGIETGVALREFRDQTTVRFAEQEQDIEAFVLRTIWLLLAACKQLGAKAPTFTRRTKFGIHAISWPDVDMIEVMLWMGPAPTLSRTRAGRLQTVVEWSQAGIISQDDARRLLEHPDLGRAMSLYTAAIESVDELLEEIARGRVVMPEPYMNLKLLVWRAQQQMLIWRRRAPERVLENLRALIVQAAWMVNGAPAPAGAVGPDQSMPADQAGVPSPGPGPGGMPPMSAGPPMPPPAAAFSPQAMQLTPGV